MTNKACVYSALILVDDEVAVNGEETSTILKAANITIEPYWPGFLAKALEGVNVADRINIIGSGVEQDAPTAKEEKKESKAEESDDDVGVGLID